jgi:Fic family protein
MRSFFDPERTFAGMPARLGVVLNRVDVASGRQQLYEDQLPELLRTLAQQTKVESIRASNAIEGVEVDPDRADRLASADRPKLRNRSEKEFAGYADALDALMRTTHLDPPTVPQLLGFHRQMLAYTEARGGYLKTEDNAIAIRGEDGIKRVIFKPPPWRETEGLMVGLCGAYDEALTRQLAHPLVVLAAFTVDLLAIHPVLDGNGRVSRLAMTHELLRLGYGVARYVSVEQRIYDSKNSYYTALEQSQRDWHDRNHTIWPFAEYLVTVLDESYVDFENRVAASRSANGMNKQERVRHWVLNAAPETFRFRDVRKAVPGVSDPTIRLVLRALKEEGLADSSGSGPGARWTKTDDSST